MTKEIFYHAVCPVCVRAERDILDLIPENQVELIHLDTDKTKVKDAENADVKSFPALVLSNGNVLHINFGAKIEDVK
ncbi:thioredoxin family protein [Sphingobacterium arenae]|uniref:Thioredoxin family protein n=1 Tax=Sphingobacterium arenae TaxID=1280598 RepID=A0ABR7Y3Q6_9SPHI|nr:thioredoxin family protein [Sphingobacterium arenae]MBD1425909.1 thioredoxin family protein [Sphingobacterium arenae]